MNTYEKFVRLFGEKTTNKALFYGISLNEDCPSDHGINENCQSDCQKCWEQALEEYNPE